MIGMIKALAVRVVQVALDGQQWMSESPATPLERLLLNPGMSAH
jgi:hypothetical protein